MDPVTGRQSLALVHGRISERMSSKPSPRIYEAGGGSASWLPPDILKKSEVTVVDIDEGQLNRNTYAKSKILADIQTREFEPGSFDLIVCYNVIEHLDAPDQAIKQFFNALSPGGLLFIAAPNPDSFSGWITKMTPHWFHVQYYRRVLGYQYAGLPGRTPFPTIFHSVVKPTVLSQYCRTLGFKVLYLQIYRGMVYDNLSERRPVLARILNVAVQCANALVLWRKDLRNGDFHALMEKP